MGMAPIAHVLFSKIMNSNPKNSKWINRDRFVLSNGHALVLVRTSSQAETIRLDLTNAPLFLLFHLALVLALFARNTRFFPP
jgi:hypothetical protein